MQRNKEIPTYHSQLTYFDSK